MLRIIMSAVMALTMFSAACAPHKAGQMTKKRPLPTPEILSFQDGNVWDMFPDHSVSGPWHAFAARRYDQPRGGQAATVAQVSADLVQDAPQVFRARLARTQFVRAMMALDSRLQSAADVAAVLADPARHRVVACKGRIETLAYNGQGSVRTITRACVAGEQLVELRVGGRWIAAFSLGCLNPLNAPIRRKVKDFCPVTWKVPKSPADGRSVIVFVPAEAIHCLPPTTECDEECVDWMRGLRGDPEDPRIKAALRRMVNGGGSAFRLQPGVAEIRLPAMARTAAEYAAWCDKREHGPQEAYFMRVD